MIARKMMAAILLLGFSTPILAGPSTVSPTIPVSGALLQSAPLRANFAAAENDINALISQNGGSVAPSSPVLGQQWLNTSAPTYILNEWDGAAWVGIASLNPGTHVWTPMGGALLGGAQTFTGLQSFGTGFSINGAAPLGPTDVGLIDYEYPNFRAYVGDGSGYSWRFSKRTASVTTDLFSLFDDGDLVIGATSDDGANKLQVNGSAKISGALAATGNISASGTSIVSGYYFQAGSAITGQGGNTRYVNDAGTFNWLTGLLGSAGATDYVVYDVVHSAIRFDVNASSGDVMIGSSTDDGTDKLQVSGSAKISAHLSMSSGVTPSIASGACGTGTNGTITGNDQAGKITIGSVATTSCAVSFGSSAWGSGPNACVIAPATSASAATTVLPYVNALSTGGFTLSGSALAGTSFYYHCM